MSTIDLQSVSGAIEAVRRESNRLKQSIETAKAERDELTSAPLCRADVTEILLEQLDQEAAAAPARLEAAVTFVASRPMKDWSAATVPVLTNGRGPGSVEGSVIALCGLLAEPLKAAVAAAMSQYPEVENAGPPRADRARKLAKLDSQIEQDEAALAELRAQASSAGLNLHREVF